MIYFILPIVLFISFIYEIAVKIFWIDLLQKLLRQQMRTNKNLINITSTITQSKQ
jgi:hypothetical protein